jgi:hypothetical protein
MVAGLVDNKSNSMNIKNFIIYLIAFGAVFLCSCQKDFTIENTPQSLVDSTIVTDTSKILSLVEFDFNNGAIIDSLHYFLKNATLNGQKKVKLSVAYGGNDSVFSTYIYNLQNQLTEIIYTNTFSTTDISKDIISWTGTNVSKIEHDSAGVIKYKYDFSYTALGNNIKVSYTRTPNTNLFAQYYPNGSVNYLTDFKNDFIVDVNFNPLFLNGYSHSIIDNGPGIPDIRWDTSTVKLNFSATGNLIKRSIYSSSIDTVTSNNPGIFHTQDTTLFNFVRSTNDNLSYTNILKTIYGNQLYNLCTYYGVFLDEFLIGGSYDNQFNNQALLTIDKSQVSWINGVLTSGGINNPLIETTFSNTFDSQNRLVYYTRFMQDQAGNFTQPTFAMKIIYP